VILTLTPLSLPAQCTSEAGRRGAGRQRDVLRPLLWRPTSSLKPGHAAGGAGAHARLPLHAALLPGRPSPAPHPCGTPLVLAFLGGPGGPSRNFFKSSQGPGRQTGGAMREVRWMQGSVEMSEEGREGEEGGKEARGLLFKFLGVPSPKDRVRNLSDFKSAFHQR